MADRPRVLLLESLATIAGGQQVLLDMLPGLGGLALYALLPGPGPLAEALKAADVDCHFVPMAGYSLVHKGLGDVARFPMDQIGLTLRCLNVARATGADLLYANSSRAFVWGTLAATLARRPIIWHVHNLLDDSKTLSLVRRLGSWPMVRRVVAASRQAADQFPGLQDRVRVVPSGVDLQVFRPRPAAGLAWRRRVGIPDTAPVVGMVADLIPLKGQDVVLQAATLCRTDVRWVLAGTARSGDPQSQEYAERLRVAAGAGVMFPGRVEDLPALLNALNLLVVASERETGPLVLLQALASGLPVVSTPVGRATELLPQDQLFPIGDIHSLAAKINHHLLSTGDPGAAGREARMLAESVLDVRFFHAAIRAQIDECLPVRARADRP